MSGFKIQSNPNNCTEGFFASSIRGPFVKLHQFDNVDLKTKWVDFKWLHKDKVVGSIDLKLNETYYQQGPNESVIIAAYYWDTSG